ncbi:MAG: hypothetical protein JXR65_06425 [Bacteroidales bacterium]|nr:hypothetical protein [Bacteroidales bacterium]
MFKKIWNKPATRKTIGILFFAYAIYFIVKIILMYIEVNSPQSEFKYQFGWIESYFLSPAIAAVVGYLFYHSGIHLKKSKNQTEKRA